MTTELKSNASKSTSKPNIVLILLDDMGYSDIGCYGGEIPTPNIDRLANNGIRFSQFYNTSRCCPTRASLLTGLYQHQTGVGHMTTEGRFDFDYGSDGYRGHINRNCVTVAQLLKEAGYHTYMTGKWHLGKDLEDRPLQRGFDKFYGSLSGAFSYFMPHGERHLMRGNEPLPEPDPKTYYTTDAFTDQAVEWIEKQEDEDPFFLYLSYNAPHWPLHAKEEDIQKFVGKYTQGWDEVRRKRFERQLEMGLFDDSEEISPRHPEVRPWEEVDEEQKARSDYRMAVYAAQIYSVDKNIGKLLNTLEEKNQLDNTLIMFLSDNGACAEPYSEFGGGEMEDINDPTKGGAISYGRGWANASNTPFRMYKNRPHEGGIRTPFIASWTNGISPELRGKFVRDAAHIIDVVPTALEISNAAYPKILDKELIPDPEGKSLTPFFTEGEREPLKYLFFEHQDNCAIRSGNWKAISKYGEYKWELYNLENDRNELHNLAAEHPDKIEEFDNAWRRWALRVKAAPKGRTEDRGYNVPKE